MYNCLMGLNVSLCLQHARDTASANNLSVPSSDRL